MAAAKFEKDASLWSYQTWPAAFATKSAGGVVISFEQFHGSRDMSNIHHSGQSAVPHQGQLLNLSIVSEARLFGESLAECLSCDARLSVHGAFQSWTEALCGCARARLDMLLLDRDLTEGLSAVKLIRGAAPGIMIVVIALCETAEEVIAWAEAGVTGYVPKHESLAQVGAASIQNSAGRTNLLGERGGWPAASRVGARDAPKRRLFSGSHPARSPNHPTHRGRNEQ